MEGNYSVAYIISISELQGYESKKGFFYWSKLSTMKCIALGFFFKLECLWLIFWWGEQVWESAGYNAESVSCYVMAGGSSIGKRSKNADAKLIQHSKSSATNIKEWLYRDGLTFTLEGLLLQVCECITKIPRK